MKNEEPNDNEIECDEDEIDSLYLERFIHIPDEIWLRIFSHVDDPADLCRLSRVSRSWRRLLNDGTLWHRLWTLKQFEASQDVLSSSPPASTSGMSKVFSFLKIWDPQVEPEKDTVNMKWKDAFLQKYSPFYSKSWSDGKSDAIHIDLENDTFICGSSETVEGEIWIRITRRVHSSSFSLVLSCVESAKHLGNHTYLRLPIESVIPTKTIEAGEWRFPFIFQLPDQGQNGEDLPPTFQRGAYCVKCQLTAKIVGQFPYRGMCTSKTLKLKRILTNREDLLTPTPYGFQKTYTSPVHGNICVIFGIPHRVFTLGEVVQTKLIINNMSNKTFDRATVRLVQYIHSPEMTKELGDWTPRDFSFMSSYRFNPVTSGLTRSLLVSFRISSSAVPTTTTEIMKISYLLRLEMTSSPYHVVISIPVTIVE